MTINDTVKRLSAYVAMYANAEVDGVGPKGGLKRLPASNCISILDNGSERQMLLFSDIKTLLGVVEQLDSELVRGLALLTTQKKTDPPKDDTGHVAIGCDCHRTGCNFCDGALWACEVCNGLEGSMPSTCPGQRMTGKQTQAVYAGRLDFRDDQWVEGATSPFCPKGLSKLAKR